MYTQPDLIREIERIIPELQSELHTLECERSIYKQVDVLAHYVADKAEHEDLQEVKQALYLADNLYERGSNSVKCAFENVLVYSFSTLLVKTGENRHKLMAIIPMTLFTRYMKQVLHRGC